MANISSNYAEHVSIVKNLKMADSFYEVREPYKDGFEAIYEKAKNQDVSITSAKDFLNTLSKEDLATLQNYTLLVNEIDVNSLSDEGAYNLLLHHYEKYDFDNDGFIQNGEGKMGELIPKNISTDAKKALVDTINEMDGKIGLGFVLLFPPKIDIPGVTQNSTNDEFYDYDTIMKRVDRILNPIAGEKRSEEVLNTFKIFKELFEKNYEELSSQKEKYSSQLSNEARLTKAKISGEIG